MKEYIFKPYTSLIDRCDVDPSTTIFRRRKKNGQYQIVTSIKETKQTNNLFK